jgi:hypothetical protein
MPNVMQAALLYAEKFNLSVIPIRPDKKPFVKWEEYQKRRATPEQICGWWRRWPKAMIGIVTGEISGVFVIDCDTQAGYDALQKLIPDSLIIPIARTPRGGWHLWFIFPSGSKLTVGAGVMPGVDFRGEGGYCIAPPSVNGDGKGYTWQEGLALGDVAPATVPIDLLKYLYIYIGNAGDRPQQTTNDHIDHNFFFQGRRDNDIFHAANCLVKGGGEIPFTREVLKILARNSNPPFPENEIQTKIESALKRSERRDRNIAAEVREWALTTNGHFLTTNVHKELQLTTREEMKAAHMAFARLCEGPEPLLERYGNQRGCYRRIDRTIEFMDFANADIENHIDLRLPLNLHTKTKLFPKAVIVIAGVSGMGKTLFAFNTIAENMGRFPIFYFNAEMGPEALKEKLSHFPIPISEWNQHMKVIDNWDFNNIADKIQPNALNVIDYLEPEGDRPYNIHGVISAIIRRLNKGTALIAIQKKPGATMGTGGIYSIKAATLAIALDWGKIEIVKNRFREADQMPSLTKINFDVHQGYKFVKQGSWYK